MHHTQSHDYKFHTFWHTVALQFYRDGCFNRAGSLAYTTLLSLVPFLAVSFSLFSILPISKDLAKNVQDLIFNNFVASSAQVVHNNLQSFIAQASHLNIFGLVSLLIAAVLLIFSIEQAFNEIWRVKMRRKHAYAFFLYWGIIIFIPIFLGFVLSLVSYLFTLQFVSKILLSNYGIKLNLLYIAHYLIIYMTFAALYKTLPNCPVPTQSALIGAMPAMILFEIAKRALSFYFFYFPAYTLIYGALAVIPIFLIWLYVSWLVILFGAVISYVHSES